MSNNVKSSSGSGNNGGVVGAAAGGGAPSSVDSGIESPRSCPNIYSPKVIFLLSYSLSIKIIHKVGAKILRHFKYSVIS